MEEMKDKMKIMEEFKRKSRIEDRRNRKWNMHGENFKDGKKRMKKKSEDRQKDLGEIKDRKRKMED